MKDFRIKFETKDGSLVMNMGNISSFTRKNCEYYGRANFERSKGEVNGFLARCGREKGVRILATDVTKSGINCIVTWL